VGGQGVDDSRVREVDDHEYRFSLVYLQIRIYSLVLRRQMGEQAVNLVSAIYTDVDLHKRDAASGSQASPSKSSTRSLSHALAFSHSIRGSHRLPASMELRWRNLRGRQSSTALDSVRGLELYAEYHLAHRPCLGCRYLA
jgi:hypothetical protein